MFFFRLGRVTYFHTGEITAMGPSEPAAVGALVDVHILQVHIHTNNTSVRERERERWREEKRQHRGREGRGVR